MIIPGFVVSLIFFPGIVIHELGHVLFCKLTKTNIQKVCYLRFGMTVGYVIHDQPSNAWKGILIAIGPVIVNTLAGFLFGFLVFGPLSPLDLPWYAEIPLGWLTLSAGMHAFPSLGDAKAIWKTVTSPETGIGPKIVGIPIIGIIYVCAAFSVFWFDLIYSVFISMYVPHLITGGVYFPSLPIFK